jgi:hypothetical protein|tara:strand:- start:10495 stop:11076 length:582 start_codon:yes stop_codon:yes gene_type:complete
MKSVTRAWRAGVARGRDACASREALHRVRGAKGRPVEGKLADLEVELGEKRTRVLQTGVAHDELHEAVPPELVVIRKGHAGAALGRPEPFRVRGNRLGTPLAGSCEVRVARVLQSLAVVVVLIPVPAFHPPRVVALDVRKTRLHEVRSSKFGGKVRPFLPVGVVHPRAYQAATFDESLAYHRRRVPRAEDVDI